MQLYKNMNNNEEIILKEIFAKPTYKFHIRELAEITKLNPNTVINLTRRLIEQGIIKQEKKKHITELYFNFNNSKAVIKKKIFNLSKLYESGVVEYIKEKYNPEAIILMGSYSRGEDIERSDIDLVVISKNKETQSLEKFEKILKRKIQLMPLDYKEMAEEFYINLINGMVLEGYIKRK